MPSLTELIAHPKTFLKANALWPSGQLNVISQARPDSVRVGTASEESKVWPVMLLAKAGVSCTRHGAPMPCFEVAPASSLGSVVLCYYLPWRPNSTKSMVIADKADLFITDTMNGCTFAGGTGGTVRVAHVNYNTFNDEGEREEGKPIDQTFMNTEVNRVFGGPAPVALRKAQYASVPEGTFPNVTVVGTRRGGVWTFYYQRRVYLGAQGMTAVYKYASVHTVR